MNAAQPRPRTERDDAGLLHELFARSVRAHGARTALEIPTSSGRERVTLSYAELDRRATVIARSLAGLVEGERVVALLLPRTSPHLIAAQLGVLRAGAAWTCLAPDHPAAHVRAVLEDVDAVALLTDAGGRAHAGAAGFRSERVLDVDALLAAAEQEQSRLPRPSWLEPSSLAYVIHTSGTTGRPKGVMIEHAGITNLVASDLELFGLGPGDRVAQGSAAVYDSSIEEAWLALSSGATLVVLDDETVRLGPDLMPWLARERITVLCPTPTLLRATGCVDPQAALPDLRLVYVGGEALPQDLADRWARGRRLVNGYGPTECSVTVTRAEVRPGEPVTIGRPVSGNRAFVLDPELQQVAEGQPGELCLGGIGLARGYLDRPELTAERFPLHPLLGRLYRTGDLVRRDGRGDLHYLGRLDAQVKLRGHRIELGAIEAALAHCPGVRAAACRVQGEGSSQVLAAHVVPSDPLAPPQWREVEARLRELLPAAHVPGRFALTEALPTTAGGKLDRAALPEIAARNGQVERRGNGPRDALERAIDEAVRATLGLSEEVGVEDDFFLDLGGTSITAAELVSILRGAPATEALAVRDVYEARTVEALAARARARHEDEGVRTPAADDPAGSPLLVTLGQALWLLGATVLASSLLYLVWFQALPWLLRGLGLIGSLLAAPLIALLVLPVYLPVSVALLVLAKRVLIGRYVPGRFPLWSAFHLRHWIVTRCAALVPWGFLQDTVLVGVVLRLLGARVGRRVHVHRGVDLSRGGWDLLALGDESSLGQEAALRTVELRDGALVIGPVTVGAGAVVEVRAAISGHACLGADAQLTALSWLAPGADVAAGERWDGIPARPAGRAGPRPELRADEPELPPALHAGLTVLARAGRGALLWGATFALLASACVLTFDLDVEAVLRWLYGSPVDPVPLAAIALLLVASGPLATVLSALVSRAMGEVRPGVLSRWGTAWLRVLSKIEAVRSAGTLLSGTLFWPAWLRLAGMRVGPRCEISTIIDVVPELCEIGSESFLADGIYLGGPRVRRGAVELGAVRLGRGTFLGNHVVVPPGTRLADDVLLGVCTVADPERVRPGSSWFGHPAFELPQREVVEVDRRLTFEPGPLRYATRLFWELLRLALPVPPTIALFAWLHLVAAAQGSFAPLVFQLLVVPALTLAPPVALVLLVLALKWALLGRVRPAQHPLWSCWCSRWDFLYVAWGAWARPFLASLEGTLMLPWFLRAMGMRIGRRVALGGGFAQVVDPDMLELADGATVDTLFQAHSFEDRVLKIDRVRIGPRASVESGSVLLYGAVIGAGARVAPHGVVMKHEQLAAGHVYEGAPTRRAGT